MDLSGRIKRFGHFDYGWSEPFRHDEETVNVADKHAVLPPAFHHRHVLHQAQITTENVFFFDGLFLQCEITPLSHHVHGMGQFVIEVLNGGVLDQHKSFYALFLFKVLIDLFCRNSGNPGGHFVSPCSAAGDDAVDQAFWPVECFKGFESL